MAPMVLIAVGLAWHNLREQDEQQMRQADNLARSVATGMDHLVDERLKALNMLASSRLVDDRRHWPELYEQAQNFVASYDSQVILADNQRRMVFDTLQPYGTVLPMLPTPQGRSAAALALETGKPQVGDVVMGPVAGVPVLGLIAPVVRAGTSTGIMLSTIEVSWFQQRLEQFLLPEGWSIVLRDGAGVDIARRSPRGFDSSRDVDADHRMVARSSISPWSVVLEIPRAVDSAGRREAMFLLAAAFLLAIVLGGVGGLWTSRRISAQVESLGEPDGGAPSGRGIAEINAARRRIAEALSLVAARDSQLHLWGEAFRHVEVGLAISEARAGTLISVNAAFARQREYTEEELIGQAASNLFPPDLRESMRAKLELQNALGHVVFESEHQRKDGSRFPVLIDLTVVRDAAGTPINRLALVLDISDRKHAERELVTRQAAELRQQKEARVAALNLMDDARAAKREAEAAADELRKLTEAVEQSVESIEITDLKARITYVNEAFIRQSGYTREEILGKNPSFLQSGNTPRENYKALWAALRQGTAWKGELYNRRKDGTEYVEFATITPIRRPDGKVTHYVAVKDDITDRKRMGAELDVYRHHLEQLVTARTTELEQARAHAESANRAKSTFLANMSHEIRTPMNAILGFTQMLRRDAVSSVDADRLGKIDSSARHLLAIINDILDLSKIEAGKVELESHDFALDAVLGHVAATISEGATAKGLAVRVDGDDVPHWLRGDLTRLRQALLNLASNAVKFTEQGSISLRARLLETHEGRSLVRFEVDDTGIGVDPADMPQLFQAFQQADASTTRRYGGTGLGLSITREIALLMGGNAGAQSTPGSGSCFWFTAWLGRGAAVRSVTPRSGVSAADLRSRHAGARVLLVEDHALNREVATDLLQSAGLVVESAENGRAALEKVRGAQFAVILMDMLMPEMDGLEATRAIRQLPEWQGVPIIAMTANAFEEDRQACRAAGMNDFIVKPVSLQALYSTLDRWLSTTGLASDSQAVIAQAVAATIEPAHDIPAAGIMARLSREAGVDPGKGVAILNGSQEKLISLLRTMATTHRNDMEKLRTCLERGAHEEARGIVHTLRGVAAMLGAKVLLSALGAVDAKLRASPGIAAGDMVQLIAAANQELERLLTIVGSAEDFTPGNADAA